MFKLKLHRIIDGNNSCQGEITEPWRLKILEKLKNRLKNITVDLTMYEKAIEK